jgi:hypothetical protein
MAQAEVGAVPLEEGLLSSLMAYRLQGQHARSGAAQSAPDHRVAALHSTYERVADHARRREGASDPKPLDG